MPWYVDLFAQDDPIRRHIYVESDASHSDVDFVIDVLGLQPGDRILDLCCGQGRHLIDLMRRGYDVVGVDLSEFQLSKCREAASKEDLQPCLVQADMRELDFDSEFDAVINMWNSFGYLESDEEDQKVLNGIARALKPGGRLLLDYMANRDSLLKRFQPKIWFQNDIGDITVYERTFDSKTGRIHHNEVFISSAGERSESWHDQRLYTFGEIDRMLRSAGMSVRDVWGDRDRSEFSMDSKGMEIVAVKD